MGRMEYNYFCWIIYVLCIHGLTTAHNIPAKDGKAIEQSEISENIKSTEVSSKQRLPNTNRSLGEDLNNIDVLIKQLNSAIHQLQGMHQGHFTPEEREGCVTNKKGKVKCKKPSHSQPTGTTMGSVEHYQSLHHLFSNVSSSFSSVQNKVLEDMVRLIMQGVVDTTKTLTNTLENSILNLTETVHTRLAHLEEQILKIVPPDKPPQLTQDDRSEPEPQTNPGTPIVDQNPVPEPSNENDTETLLSNTTIIGLCMKIKFTDFIKYYWLPHDDIMHTCVNGNKDKSIEELNGHNGNDTSSLIWKFQFGHEEDSPGRVLRLLTTLPFVLMVCVTAAVLWWSCYQVWRDESDYTPSLLNKSAGIYASDGLTVVTVSTYKSTHSQVKTIIKRLTQSDRKLHIISNTTRFIKIEKNTAMKDNLLDNHSDSEKLLVFIDVSRDEKEALLDVQDGLQEKLKALSLQDICEALGDTVIIIYGDSASHQLPLGAVYNTSVVDRLPVPALRALCRVGRFLTVNTAFTNTQTVLLQHWLQTPAKIPCEEDE